MRTPSSAPSDAFDWSVDGLGDVGANDAPSGAGEAYAHLSGLDAPTIYCAAKLNSQGCTPATSTEGVASLSIADTFHVRAEDVINQKFGLLFLGAASLDQPFMGGTLCVQAPHQRTDVQSSGGSAAGTDCTGSFDFHFSHAYMATESVAPGTRVHGQYWYRDPAGSFQVGLTDAVAFDVVP